MMEFGQLIRLCAFLFGAVFSFADIISDCLLSQEYYSTYHILSTCGTNSEMAPCPNLSEYSSFDLTWSNNSTVIQKKFIDANWYYFILTMVWLCLGGISHILVIICYLCKRNSCFSLFSWPLRLLILLSAPFLMAPAILNLLGAYLVFCNKATLHEDLIK